MKIETSNLNNTFFEHISRSFDFYNNDIKAYLENKEKLKELNDEIESARNELKTYAPNSIDVDLLYLLKKINLAFSFFPVSLIVLEIASFTSYKDIIGNLVPTFNIEKRIIPFAISFMVLIFIENYFNKKIKNFETFSNNETQAELKKKIMQDKNECEKLNNQLKKNLFFLSTVSKIGKDFLIDCVQNNIDIVDALVENITKNDLLNINLFDTMLTEFHCSEDPSLYGQIVSSTFELLKSKGFPVYDQIDSKDIQIDFLYGYEEYIEEKKTCIQNYFDKKEISNCNMVFSGIPGTGKTQVIYNLIKNTCECYLLISKITDLRDIGMLSFQVGKLLKQNKKVALYFNEVDSFLTNSHNEIVSLMCCFIDSLFYKNVVFFYDTNYRNKIDGRIIRKGRVFYDNSFGLPDTSERINLFNNIFTVKNTYELKYVLNSDFLEMNAAQKIIINNPIGRSFIETNKKIEIEITKDRIVSVFAFFTAGQTHATIVSLAHFFDQKIKQTEKFDKALLFTFKTFFLHDDSSFLKEKLKKNGAEDNSLERYFEKEFFNGNMKTDYIEKQSELLDRELGIVKGGNQVKMNQESYTLYGFLTSQESQLNKNAIRELIERNIQYS